VRVIDLQAGRVRGGFVPLVRYLCEHRPDALLASMWPLTTLAVLAAKVARFRGRVVVSEHNALTRSARGHRIRAVNLRVSMRWINSAADTVIGVSRGVVDDLHALGLPKKRVKSFTTLLPSQLRLCCLRHGPSILGSLVRVPTG
jgi:hypothetical protein